MKRHSSEYKLINGIIGVLLGALAASSILWWGIHKPAELKVVEKKEISVSSVSQEPVEVYTVEPVEEPEPELTYTEDELFYMAATIYNEAGGDECSDDTRRLVGYVVLNRVDDSRFPDTIKGVLEQKRQYGLFYRTGIKFADRHTSPQEQYAVKRAYKIAKEVLETDDIPIPSDVVFQAEFQQGSSIYKYQDGIYFCHS